MDQSLFESPRWRAALNFLKYFCSRDTVACPWLGGISIGEWSLSRARCMDNSKSSFLLNVFIFLNIGSSFFLVHLILIHYLTRTAEWNIDSARLEQGITPRTLKVRIIPTSFYVFIHDFVGILQIISSVNGVRTEKDGGQPGFELKWDGMAI